MILIKRRKKYIKPALLVHGDLKEITKAGYGPGSDYRGKKGSS